MELSKKYNFYLPSKDSDDVVDINQISDNFRNIDKNIPSMQDVNKMLEAKQDTLASGINIKTINHQTILGEGNIDIKNEIEVDQIYNPESDNPQSGTAVAEAVSNATIAGSLKGTATGEVIRLDDVSPVEHEVKITLESINLAVPNDFVVENNGMTATTNPDGTITVTGSVADGTKATLLQLISRKSEAEFITLETGQIYKLVVKKDGTSILTFGTKTVYTDTGEVYWGTVETTDIMRPRKVQLVYLQKNLAEGDTSLCGTYTVQLVKGTKVGEYTPYVQVENVKLSRCGRNLIAYTDETKTVGGSGVTVIKTKNSAAFTINGTATVDASIVATSPMLLPAGTYTASVDGLNTVSTNFDRCYVWDVLAGKVIVNDIMTGKPKTFTLTESTTVRIDFVFASGTSYENKVVTVQLQEGETASEWEEYNNATYTPETDGTVKGVTALSPNMTFTTDTAGVTINCEYNRDINAAFAELQQAIISFKADQTYNPESENAQSGKAVAQAIGNIETLLGGI